MELECVPMAAQLMNRGGVGHNDLKIEIQRSSLSGTHLAHTVHLGKP